MKLIFFDEHIVVCEKNAGEMSEGNERNCLPLLVYQELKSIGEKSTDIFCVHRLDKETVGLIVFARSSKSAAILSESIQNGDFKKEYLAVLCGTPEKITDTLTDLLFYDRKRGKTFVVNRERNGVKKASLEYKTIQSADCYTLVHIKLHTGRTHQIRAQFSSRGLPVAGDRRYGAPKNEFNSIALLSYKLSFPHPISKNILEFSAKLPKSCPWTQFEI